jgi:hypothetical protein
VKSAFLNCYINEKVCWVISRFWRLQKGQPSVQVEEDFVWLEAST